MTDRNTHHRILNGAVLSYTWANRTWRELDPFYHLVIWSFVDLSFLDNSVQISFLTLFPWWQQGGSGTFWNSSWTLSFPYLLQQCTEDVGILTGFVFFKLLPESPWFLPEWSLCCRHRLIAHHKDIPECFLPNREFIVGDKGSIFIPLRTWSYRSWDEIG